MIGEPFGGGGGLVFPLACADLGMGGDELRQGRAVGLSGEVSGAHDFFDESASHVYARFSITIIM